MPPDMYRQLVEAWNLKFDVGTRVRYWSVMPPLKGDRGFVTATRSEAEFRNGTPTVFLDGVSGYVHLAHVEPVRADVPASWAEPFTDLLPAEARLCFLADDQFTAAWTDASGCDWTVAGTNPLNEFWVSTSADGRIVTTVRGVDLATRIRHLVTALRLRGALKPLEANQ